MTATHTPYGRSSDFDAFAVSLHQTLNRHHDALEEEGLGSDARQLSRWIERVYAGSVTALEALELHGPQNLVHLRDQIMHALEEQNHIAEESPVPAATQDDKQHDYAAALRDVSDAIDQLIKATEPETTGDDDMKLVTPIKDGQSMDTGIGEDSRAKVAEALGGMLASTYSLYVKSLFYHWNVTGPRFHSLHKLFEEHYQDLHEAGDEIAERIRALGHFTPGTLKSFGALSAVDDDEKLPSSAEDMLKNLKAAHAVCAAEARKVLNVAEEAGDEVTVDLMVGRMRFHDEAGWMLGASL
ncbi:Dps family protein [Kordiimonas sp.]|uniref:Dps family protein n=1 Tax=Kordiimonas sp. TaxID=1970157 RepID=UPI003A95A72F